LQPAAAGATLAAEQESIYSTYLVNFVLSIITLELTPRGLLAPTSSECRMSVTMIQTRAAAVVPARSGPARGRTLAVGAALLAGLMMCGCGGRAPESAGALAANMARATCGPGDRPEQILQGQVPISETSGGFKGYSCNLEQTAAAHSSRDEGAVQQFAMVRDRAGHRCGYAGGYNYFNGAPGTTVFDLTDPNHAQQTALIMTPGLWLPGEGLRVHQGRGLLISAYYMDVTSEDDRTHGFDIYDVETDCRHPQVLASTTQLSFSTKGLTTVGSAVERIYGHEGAMSPDGNTYWISDFPHGTYHAIDISDPRHPKWLTAFSSKAFYALQAYPHSLSISADGNRAYATSIGPPTTLADPRLNVPTDGEYHDGFLIMDTSEVQARKPNAQIRLISETDWHDGAFAQMAISFKVKGKPFVVVNDEAGIALGTRGGMKYACATHRPAFGMARIFDISDESKPKLVKRIVLEANDPKNCPLIDPEISALPDGVFFGMYDPHMCSVDNRDEATTLACSYWKSGVRVYDIRDPANPKEIAYFVPPAQSPGSTGYCAAIPILDAHNGMLYTNCTDTGVLSLKFTNGVWPFPESTTPDDRQL
jgi:hypothetical protein